ncbi:hypothetical protein [Devosia sp.]|uniref:hypothetical protein n=1 Tax=Devosia sp. TaxID=1871048 RepID=UPI001AD3C5E9|nr:hypothetical protein [Devosia sp.]MBN9308300.1 hypothetical protein [Devosia sp.]
MGKFGKGQHRLVILFSLALVCGGVAAAYSEASSYLSGGSAADDSFAAFTSGQPKSGLSVASARYVLDGCFDATTSLRGRLQPTPLRRAIAGLCLAQADAITDRMPSYSYAWYIGALAAAALDDPPSLADRLRHSQQTGPTEQWIAELRVALAEDHLADLPADVRDLNERDLALLVRSTRGIASIAQRYVGDPAFRERITRIVETMPPDQQQRFVSSVDFAARQSGSTR